MSRIFGIHGKFNGNLLNIMAKAMEYTDSLNKDKFSKGIFISSKESTIYNNKFCNISLPNNEGTFYKIGLGAVNSIQEDLQPIKYKNLILVFDGVIYNLDEINSILGNKSKISNSSSILAIKLLYKFYTEFADLKKSVEIATKLINGNYAFSIFDGENLAISRDNIGISPLYYSNEQINLNNNNFNSFASEKKDLWIIGINDNKINSLKPGHILYNWKDIPPKTNPWDIDYFNNKINNIKINEDMNYNQIKNNLLKLIKNSTYDRIDGLDHIGLVFSGGVDSTILATLIKKYIETHEIDVTLYTVGVENSKDLKYSKKVAKQLGFPLKTTVVGENIVRNALNPVLEAIEEADIMKIGVGMTLYLATKLAAEDNVPVVLAGQGADELFAGYNRYSAKLVEEGQEALQKELISDIKYCYEVNLERDAKVANANGIQLRVPYLEEKLVNFSLNIPIKYKIKLDIHNKNNNKNNNDNKYANDNNDNLRKRILRELALDIGIDEEIAMRPKKAAQYGSGIDKILRKKILKDTDINKVMEDIIYNYSNN